MMSTDEQALESLAEALPIEAQRAYGQLTQQIKTVISLEQFSALMVQYAESKKAELLQQFRELTPYAKDIFYQKFDEHLGALCLSEVPDSLLMWSHYAASHTGFVLEFDSHHPYFHEKRSPNDEFRHLRRVHYRETRPSAPLSELEGTDLFLVKSGHWGYEREWRVLRALSDAPVVVPNEPLPIHLFRFPRDALKGVILGSRITKTAETSVRSILQAHTEYKEVQLKRARADDTHFLLRIESAAI